MTAVADDLLRTARTSIDQARVILGAGVPSVAAREADMAAFKDISDYRTDRTVSADEAEAVVSKAAEFIDRVAALVVS